MKNKVNPLDLSPHNASKFIREAAQDSARVIWTKHVLDRMKERRISTNQVLTVLRQGVIIEGPARGVRANWECTVEYFVAGDRITVVVAIEVYDPRNPVILVTTY